MSSLQSHLLRTLLIVQKQAQHFATIEGVRRLAARNEAIGPLPPGVRAEPVQAGDFIYEWLIPDTVDGDATIMYIHGGGFTLPLYHPLRRVAAYIARDACLRALAIRYRMAPEHPFPAAVEDGVTAYRWLLAQPHITAGRIVLMGESAGGNLVVTVTLALREAGLPPPLGIVAMGPVFDFEGQSESQQAANDVLASRRFFAKFRDAYIGDADPQNPLMSPLYADLGGMPPIYMQTGEKEVLRSDAERLADRAQAAGVPVTLDIWPGMWHAWHLFTPFLPEARQAVKKIVDHIRDLVEDQAGEPVHHPLPTG